LQRGPFVRTMGFLKHPKSTYEPLVTLTIDDLAFGGSGVARHDGKVWFVPFTIPGEKVTAAPVKSKKDLTEGRLVEVREASMHRVKPQCAHFGVCGGCAYQHINYQEQFRWKVHQVRQALSRIAKIASPPEIKEIPAPEPYQYRNRISLQVVNGKAGFTGVNGRDFVPIERCEIAAEELNLKLAALRRRSLRDGRLTLRQHEGRKGFYQTNDAAAALLVDEVVRLTGPGPGRLVDAYCGAGIFAKAMRDRFDSVVGIDWSDAAIERAQAEASPKETYYAADVALELLRVLKESDAATEVIVDPPREGLGAQVCGDLVAAGGAGLVYVSCNPGTMARDLSLLASAYTLESLTVLDMFPQTAGIECIARLVRL